MIRLEALAFSVLFAVMCAAVTIACRVLECTRFLVANVLNIGLLSTLAACERHVAPVGFFVRAA